MKLESLKEYIRSTVRQEIKSVIKEELKSYLSEVFSNKVTPSTKLNNDLIEESSTPTPVEKPKKFIKYTKNEELNKILNETTGGVPQENNFVGLMGGFESKVEQINEVKAPENAPEPVKTVVNAINRDYRSLLRAVDKKRTNKLS